MPCIRSFHSRQPQYWRQINTCSMAYKLLHAKHLTHKAACSGTLPFLFICSHACRHALGTCFRSWLPYMPRSFLHTQMAYAYLSSCTKLIAVCCNHYNTDRISQPSRVYFSCLTHILGAWSASQQPGNDVSTYSGMPSVLGTITKV